MSYLLLNKYEILRVIGNGGMGRVYEAREVSTGRHVAIKRLTGESLDEGNSNLLRFQQEARIAGALDSPHVTAIFECLREPETNIVFQVMELLEGEDLGDLLHRVGALEPEVALRIATQVCIGLSAAHEAGVVHRDIKPDNIFLSRRGQGDIIVKVLDFGIAKIRRSRDAAPGMTAPLQAMTFSGELLGTPLYMAPEQFEEAKNADTRVDVYSLGVTLHALLAGTPPHAELKSFMQIFRAMANQSAPTLAQRAPWVRPSVIAVVEKATQLDPNARYANATEMLAALMGVLEGSYDIREEMLVSVSEQQKGLLQPSREGDPKTETVMEQAPNRADMASEANVPWWRKTPGS